MANKSFIVLIVLAFFLGGCAYQQGWTPTVDTYNDPNLSNLERNKMECRTLARQASGDVAEETVTGAVMGGVLGAIGGVIIGAAVGSPGTGAAIGAAAGGLGAGALKGKQSDKQFKESYKKCMRNRGHKVIN